jgi:hypothetical protein
MKRVVVGLFVIAQLLSARGASAFTYWLPKRTTFQVKGSLTFTPHVGTPFVCSVNFHGRVARAGVAWVNSATVKGKGCSNVIFGGLPWALSAPSMNAGEITPVSWVADNVSCQQGVTYFGVTPGFWGPFNSEHGAGGCIDGQLSNPKLYIGIK